MAAQGQPAEGGTAQTAVRGAGLAATEAGRAVAAQARHYVSLLESAGPLLKGVGEEDGGWAQMHALRRCSADLENLLAAQAAVIAAGDTASARIFATYFWLALDVTSEFRTMREACQALVEFAGRAGDSGLEWEARQGLVHALSRLGQLETAQAEVDAASGLPEAATPRGAATLCKLRGMLAYFHGDYPAARALHLEALRRSRELAGAGDIAAALMHLGNVEFYLGDFVAATRLNEEALALWQAAGNLAGESSAVGNLGSLAFLGGELATAEQLQGECLRLCRNSGDRQNEAGVLGNLGQLRALAGDWANAHAMQEQSLALRQEIGDRAGEVFALCNLGNVEYHLQHYAVAHTLQERAVKLSRAIGDRRGEAWALRNLSCIAYRTGDLRAALAAQAQSLALRRASGDKAGVVAACACAGALLSVIPVALSQAARILHDAVTQAEQLGFRHELEVQQLIDEAQLRLAKELPVRAGQADGLPVGYLMTDELAERTAAVLSSFSHETGSAANC